MVYNSFLGRRLSEFAKALETQTGFIWDVVVSEKEAYLVRREHKAVLRFRLENNASEWLDIDGLYSDIKEAESGGKLLEKVHIAIARDADIEQVVAAIFENF